MVHREMCWALPWPVARACESITDPFSSFSPLLWSPPPSFKWLIPFFFPHFFFSLFTSNEGYSVAHTRAKQHTWNERSYVSLCATAAPPTQLLSRECTGPSNSERESEQKREILARAGERGMGKDREREEGGRGGSRRALISDESNSVNCC